MYWKISFTSFETLINGWQSLYSTRDSDKKIWNKVNLYSKQKPFKVKFTTIFQKIMMIFSKVTRLLTILGYWINNQPSLSNLKVLAFIICLCRWYDVFSEWFIIDWTRSWITQLFFHFFRIDTKSNKMQNSGNGSHERSSVGMKCIDILNEAVKILDTYFSYNNTINEDLTSSKFFQMWKVC